MARPSPNDPSTRWSALPATASDRLYLEELSATPTLSEAEAAELATRAGADATVRDRMIRGHMHLVIDAALRFAHRGVPLADLIEMGSIALRRSVQKLDTRRGRRFATFAAWKIRRAMRRLVAKLARRGPTMAAAGVVIAGILTFPP